ncbi:MAG: tyrosine-type recombinase/integrase [Anaerolineales bacterium]|jgi:integrase/recombinase XerD
MNWSPSVSSSYLRPSGSLPLSQAIVGFLNSKLAEGLSSRTIESYTFDLTKWVERTGDRDISKVSGQDVSAYLAWLRTDYTPHRFGGKDYPLSPKTLRNVWTSFSSFFKWAERELRIPYPMRDIPTPRFPRSQVPEFSREEVERMLKACMYKREANTVLRRAFVMRRSTSGRDVAILLLLLDTGVRASELCALKVGDLDLKTGRVEIKNGVPGGAKGGKGRTVYLGKSARRALWNYLSRREDGRDPDAPLFLVSGNRLMRPNALLHVIEGIGKRAGVSNAFPHKFRHTFAITYLRSGGDVFTLQQILGHGSLDMVRNYARIAQSDVADAHRRASPVDNWRL